MMFEIGKCTSCGDPSGKLFAFCPWCDTASTQHDEHWAASPKWKSATAPRRSNFHERHNPALSYRPTAETTEARYHGYS